MRLRLSLLFINFTKGFLFLLNFDNKRRANLKVVFLTVSAGKNQSGFERIQKQYVLENLDCFLIAVTAKKGIPHN